MELAIDTYKQNAVIAYKTPSSRRFFTNKARRLIRLAKRIHEGRLFIPDIVAMLREAADELIALGNIILLTEKATELLQGLSWIQSKDFAPEDLEWDVREKTRHHVRPEDKVRCNLCGAHLVYPAQIVWRRGLMTVATSADIGIYCLTREAVRNGWGKLQDLITEVRAVRARERDSSDTTALPEAAAASLPDDQPPVLPAETVTTIAPRPTPEPLPYPRPMGRPAPAPLQLPLVYAGESHA